VIRTNPTAGAIVFAVLAGLAACDTASVLEPAAEGVRPQFTEGDCEACEHEPFDITQAYAYFQYQVNQAWAKTETTHNAVFTGQMVLSRAGTGGSSWTVDIGSNNYGYSKVRTVALNLSGPCSGGEGPVYFAGSHNAKRSLFPWQTASRTSYTHISACATEEEQQHSYEQVSGGEYEEEPVEDGYSWCLVRVRYWQDTGEIISMTVLYCW
jgi:hypothetical protein